MRCRGAQVCVWARGSCRPPRLSQPGGFPPVRTYSAQPPPPPPPPPTDPAPPDGKGGAAVVKERALAALQHAGQLGQRWGQRSARAAASSADVWWRRYEEFVGLNEVRGAQTQVTEAEAAFMVARATVREAHGGLEALQLRLKEVRDRLDRVSREEAHYLELATLEHRLLQEERRLRTAYENAEGAEREKFSLFSAGVRASHEKERARAERTKNWSLVGSVLGALIGALGSTYINRVRLQELKSLLLEAQKGPESLQEALQVQAGDHRAQQGELRALIDSLGDALTQRGVGLREARTPPPTQVAPLAPQAPQAPPPTWPLEALKDLQVGNQKTESLLEALRPQVGHLGEGLGRVEAELQAVRRLMETQEARLQEARLQEARLQEAARLRPEGPVRPEGPEGPEGPVGPERGDQWEPAAAARRLEASQRTLGEQIRTNTLYNAAFAYSAAAVTVSAVYLLTRGTG